MLFVVFFLHSTGNILKIIESYSSIFEDNKLKNMVGRVDYTIVTVPARRKVVVLKSLFLVINDCFVFGPEVK